MTTKEKLINQLSEHINRGERVPQSIFNQLKEITRQEHKDLPTLKLN